MKIPVSMPFRIIKHVSKTLHPRYLAQAYFGFIFKKLTVLSFIFKDFAVRGHWQCMLIS